MPSKNIFIATLKSQSEIVFNAETQIENLAKSPHLLCLCVGFCVLNKLKTLLSFSFSP